MKQFIGGTVLVVTGGVLPFLGTPPAVCAVIACIGFAVQLRSYWKELQRIKFLQAVMEKSMQTRIELEGMRGVGGRKV